MASGSPFEEEDLDRTVVRRPGPAQPAAPAAPASAAASPSSAFGAASPARKRRPARSARADEGGPEETVWALGAINPLCAVAAPLLALAVRLRESPQPANLDQARDQAIAEVRSF